MYNVICVKFGTKYDESYVRKLYQDIRDKTESEFNFYCYTDRWDGPSNGISLILPLGKPTLKRVWNKLRLFDPAMPISQHKTYFFDLDVKILKDPLIDLDDWSKITIVDSHWKVGKLYNRLSNYDVKINSSVIAWIPMDTEDIWDHFNTGLRDYYMRKYVGIDRFIVHEDIEYNTFNHSYIQSKKYQPNVDYDASVLTFEEIAVGIEDLI
jgi:hypothetical protein|tara:strand:+ start:920 stop:1549 length:630 start_codon:yes stop_codon:yes gene_type:complete